MIGVQAGDPHGGAIHDHHWPTAAGHGSGVYFSHGLGEHAGRYARLARWFNERGWQVAAHDHPGHGRSGGVRGVLARDPSAADVLVERFGRFAQKVGAAPLLLGHSMGGALATHAVLAGTLEPAGLVLSSPAFRLRLDRLQSAQLAVMARLAPDFTVTARLTAPHLTHDVGIVHAWQQDPLISRRASARLIKWLATAGAECLLNAPSLKVPALLLIAGDDHLVDADAGSFEFPTRCPRELVRVHRYPDCYHELFNETSDRLMVVLSDLEAWLQQQPDLTKSDCSHALGPSKKVT